MNDPRIVDKRQEPKPERPKFHVYPTCRTCRHFDHFVDAAGQATAQTVCVIDSPKVLAQIRGEDGNGNVLWAVFQGWPVVLPGQRCGKHAARDAN